MPLDFSVETKRLERKLTAIQQKGFLPQHLLSLVSNTATLQLASLQNISVTPPTPSATADQHAQGRPLITRDEFVYDIEQTAILFGKLLALMSKSEGSLATASAKVHIALENKQLSLPDVYTAFMQDQTEFFAQWAKELPDTPSFLRFLAQGSLTPSLQTTAEHLAAHHNNEQPWSHGYCPICGSLPLMGTLQEKEGNMFHTCSLCRFAYRAKRLECPFCGEDDQQQLAYFTAEEEPGFSVHVCRSCSSYIKVTDFREFDRTSIPVLDDLESLTLDIVARKQGFSRPTLSAWGF